MQAPPANPADRQWFIIGRWQQYLGESRANLLRVVAIGAFYLVELLNYHGLSLGFLQMPRQEHVTPQFHRAVTLLVVGWTFLALIIAVCLRRRIFPKSLIYISTACDLVLLTSILAIAQGPKSPVVVAYFLIIALAGLRFSLPLVWCATLGSMAGYLFLLGYQRWYLKLSEDQLLPRYHQLMFLLALALAGVILGQVVRRVRQMAEDYARRVAAAGEVRP